MKRLTNVFILGGGILFLWLILSGVLKFECIFKMLFDMRCPGCGLTRSFRSILSLDLYSSVNYNILGIPLFIILIIIFIGLIIDIIKNSNNTILFIGKILEKNYIMIIALLIITLIINNVNKI